MVPNAATEGDRPSQDKTFHYVSEYRYAPGECYCSSAELVSRMMPKCSVTIRVDGEEQKVMDYRIDLAPRTRVEHYNVRANGTEWMKLGEHYITTLTQDVFSHEMQHYVSRLDILPARTSSAFLMVKPDECPAPLNGDA